MLFLNLSPTRVGTVMACGAKYRYRYLERLQPVREPVSRVFGRSIHWAIERHLGAGELLEEAFEEIWGEVDPDLVSWGKQAADDRSAHDDWGAKGLSLLRVLDFGALKPLGVELPYHGLPLRDLSNGCRAVPGIRLGGRLDLVADSGESGGTRLIDFKTSGRRSDGAAYALDWQPVWYLYFRLVTQEPVDKLEVWELVYTKTPEVRVFPLSIDHSRLESFYWMVRFAAGLIRRGDFHQNPGPHCAWCDYRHLCRKEPGAFRHYYRKERGDEAA